MLLAFGASAGGVFGPMLAGQILDWVGLYNLLPVSAGILFVSLLGEKEKRLYAGVESLKLGRGGDRQIADLLGLHAHTVAAGRHELRQRDYEIERTRRAGGGRQSVKKKRRK